MILNAVAFCKTRAKRVIAAITPAKYYSDNFLYFFYVVVNSVGLGIDLINEKLDAGVHEIEIYVSFICRQIISHRIPNGGTRNRRHYERICLCVVVTNFWHRSITFSRRHTKEKYTGNQGHSDRLSISRYRTSNGAESNFNSIQRSSRFI